MNPAFDILGFGCVAVDAIRQVMAERLEMLPLNKPIGCFSDAYCIKGTYGKMLMVRKLPGNR